MIVTYARVRGRRVFADRQAPEFGVRAEAVHPPLTQRRVPAARRDLGRLLRRVDLRHVQVPDAGVEEPRDPLAVPLGRADDHGKIHRPRERCHVGDGLDGERRVLHVDPREVEAGGLEQRQHRRGADHRHPRADLHFAALGADPVGVLVHRSVSVAQLISP
jgi:hypothetical protein